MRYRVICTEQVPVTQPTSHAHIVKVGTGPTTASYTQKWTLAEVIAAIGRGDEFHTVSPSTGKTAQVKVVPCGKCGSKIIRSSADALTDNNLDSLPRCG